MSNFDPNELGNKIKQARERAGYTRDTLAETMYISRSAIAKWEQGKNTPRIPELMSLAEILKVDIKYFLNEEEQTMVLEELTIDNPNAAKTIVYRGIKEIIPAWEAYYKDYGNAINNSFLSEEDCIWAEENTFRILISLKTNELVAVRDFGMYHPTTVDFLFRTEYLPLFTHQPESAEALEARAKETVDQFYMETQEMLNRYDKPLFLVEHLGTNNYLAWSLAENKYLFVYGFKTYRENFRISEIDTKTPNNITDNNEYSILPPSRKLIKMISSFDSQLNPEIWENKMRWDVWEARPEKIPIDLHDTSYTNLYNEAIAVINLGRKEDLGYDNDFASLESRVRRFEDLNTMGFPAMLMEKETELIKESMETIKAKLKWKPKVR